MTLKQKPLLEHSVIKSENLLFLTENAQNLKGKVDFIYIDPPKNLSKTASLSKDKVTKPNRRKHHERWVDFMRIRLAASRPSLKNTGFIAASADDTIQPRLRLLMDEVFGEDNFIGMVTIDTGSVINNARLVSSSHEYLLLYAKSMPVLLKSGTKWRKKREGLDILRKQERKLRLKHGENYESITEELREWLKSQNFPQRLKQFYNADSKGLYTYSDLSAPRNGLYYEVINPSTGNPVSVPTRGWGVSEDTFGELIDSDQIIWGTTDSQQPLKKLYLKDTPDQVIRSVFSFPSRSPEKLLQKILGEEVSFEEPKDLEFMKHIIDVMTPKDALIMDFFAGSGTTGHAVLDLNYEDPTSSRKFILCSNDENSVYSHILKPRIEAIVNGKWADRQHRPRKATIKTKF